MATRLMTERYKFSLPPTDRLEVKVKSPHWCFNYNLLDDDNLNRIGLTRSDITEVEPVFSIPGSLYEEVGVARKNHLLLGSACAILHTDRDYYYSIDDIWYFDENPRRNHFEGKRHWNHERRYVKHLASKSVVIDWTKHVEGHAIEETPYLEISLDPGPSGSSVKGKVYRPPITDE